MTREVMQQALEALDELTDKINDDFQLDQYLDVMDDLREALAQPDATLISEGTMPNHSEDSLDMVGQKPAAWIYEVNHTHTRLDLFEPPDDAYDEGTLYPLYTSPPKEQQSCDKCQPLTDKEIYDIADAEPYGGALIFARAIEAAHGIGDKT